MDRSWTGQRKTNFPLGCSSLANHGGLV
jgi:hypothetical protein